MDGKAARVPASGITLGAVGRARIALAAPIVLIASTYPVFQVADSIVDDAVGGRLAWFVGMAVYWVIWGGFFSVWILGARRAWELIRPQRPSWSTMGHVAFVIAMAAVVRFTVPGMDYDKATVGAAVLLLISPFANGVCEELLWRGVFLDVFPDNLWLRAIVPSIWFGLWHLVPGSIDPAGPHIGMVIGPIFMGLYLAFLSKRTGTIWWAILAHALGGLVMIT